MRQDATRDVVVRGESQDRTGSVLRRLHGSRAAPCGFHGRASLLEQRLPSVGELDPARVAQEQLDAKLGLEPADLL